MLAAGAARRFGSPKQLAVIDGRAMVEHALHNTLTAGIQRVVVMLGRTFEAEAGSAGGARRGESSMGTVREGRRRAAYDGSTAVNGPVVMLGEQPLIPGDATTHILAARAPGVVALRATYDGSAVVLERSAWADATRSPEEGARVDLFVRPDTSEVPATGLGVLVTWIPARTSAPYRPERLAPKRFGAWAEIVLLQAPAVRAITPATSPRRTCLRSS